MNIYNYILNPEIAAHCEKIRHTYNPVEMAVIIDRSNKTIEEKHNAYREIINEYPDMPITEKSNIKIKDSLHNYLKELIIWEDECINFCTTDRTAKYYPFISWYREENDTVLCNNSFPTISKAWEYLCVHKEVYLNDVYRAVTIFKSNVFIDSRAVYAKDILECIPPYAELNCHGKILLLRLFDRHIFPPGNLCSIQFPLPPKPFY